MHTVPLAPTTAPTFTARGPLSEALITSFSSGQCTADLPLLAQQIAQRLTLSAGDTATHDDLQLSLFLLYACFSGSIPQISAEHEWDVTLISTRRLLEAAFERDLRERIRVPPLPEPRSAAVAHALFALAAADTGPSLSKYLAKHATHEQALEFLMQRSIYTLREADPHSWAIPRLTGLPKCALVEIQSDEYGGGRPDRVHAEIFARTMRSAGLDATYGAYLNAVPAITLASHNMMSMFGLNRSHLGAIVGHLAAFEMTSSIPNRLYGDGFRRLGYGAETTDYFDEHVEADAVHEQIASHDLAGALAEQRPELLPDIMFGAAACLAVDGWGGAHMYESWARSESSLRDGVPHA